jgi:hypothetical protein
MKNILVLCLFLTAVLARAAEHPKLFISYSAIFDGACSQKTGFAIDHAWMNEVQARQAEFQAAWDAEAPALFAKLFELTGKSFSRKELSVTLSVCNIVSMSNPFLINVKWFLKSFNKEEAPSPLHGFVELVFHEFIHNYLVEIFDWRLSEQLYKYKDEAPGVLSHLHLMALQKTVYLALGRQDLLDWLSFFNNKVGGDYARTWEIIDAHPNLEAFVAELKVRRAIRPQ